MRRFWPLIKFSFVVMLVVAPLGWVWAHYNLPTTPDRNPNPCELEPFLGHLQSLWDRYLDMVQLLITLLTGVIAVSAGMLKFGPREDVVDREDFASGIVGLIIGLACAVMWRVDSQLLMEIEMFGNPGKVQALYEMHKVSNPFTSSFHFADHITVFSKLAGIFMAGTAVGLIVGLALLSRFAYKNLPSASRQGSKA